MNIDRSGFTSVVTRFTEDQIARGGKELLQEATQTAAETLVIGSRFGPGAAGPDTGFLRASFRVGLNRPASGPKNAAKRSKGGRKRQFAPRLDLARVASFTFGARLYVTTQVNYAIYLEDQPKKRRTGPSGLRGSSTAFVAPVERAWPRMINDAARRQRRWSA